MTSMPMVLPSRPMLADAPKPTMPSVLPLSFDALCRRLSFPHLVLVRMVLAMDIKGAGEHKGHGEPAIATRGGSRVF